MPSTSRRQFLKSLLSTGLLLSSFDFGLDRFKVGRRIVSIHLAGGADVFNTFLPAMRRAANFIMPEEAKRPLLGMTGIH